MTLDEFFQTIQKTCLPGIWSKGIGLTRTQSVVLDAQKPDEITLRVKSPEHPVSRRVSLWPEDEDWYCDCEGPNDVCAHVAAAVITLKNAKPDSEAASSPKKSNTAQVVYKFTRKEGQLEFERWISQNEKAEPLVETLVGFVGGVSSGRIRSLPVLAAQDDYSIDYLLGEKRRGIFDRATLLKLIPALSQCSQVWLDGTQITTSPKPLQIQAEVLSEGSGFRLRQCQDPSITEVFKNGAALCGTILRGIELPKLTSEERDLLSNEGTYFPRHELRKLVSQIVPELEKRISLKVVGGGLPQIKVIPPRMVLRLDRMTPDTLCVQPTFVYSETSSPKEIYVGDPEAEKRLAKKLQDELQLAPCKATVLKGDQALSFTQKLKGWEVAGNGLQAFTVTEPLTARFETQENRFDVFFEVPGFPGQGSSKQRFSSQEIFQAWRENSSYIPLLGGGFAPLPKDWLNRYGERLHSLFELRQANQELPSYALPQVAQLYEETGQTYPESLKRLAELLGSAQGIQETPLPSGLNGTLRPYQKTGYNWLSLLKSAGMGAMLADDMGLGKTLQALCTLQGRTLIIVPTSVLHSWSDQITQFRPNLKYSLYYGQNRVLDRTADVVLTSYALLRIDQEVLIQENWETVILDEAQTIKNPRSQTARASHRLNSKFKMALSGTPIENRLDDLWSQFQFLNPGLLGNLEDFQDHFATPIGRGDRAATEELKKRVAPFILRRLKQEVAPELPPKTQTVLYCELSPEEREVYETVLAASRKEVLEKLEAGGSVFAVLELLLRLRQACCHASLVPGQTVARSSKIDLLLETLEKSLVAGHRALIFSQWTSYLDLIEPFLRENQITFNRLDGSTQNRQEIVREFQTGPHPQVMLISLKAGGVGITLTAADHIFLMDPWWNPTVEDQAADRAHRIGQTNPVLIHRLIAEDTIEDRILTLQKLKVQMAASILDNGAAAAAITREDILQLLG